MKTYIINVRLEWGQGALAVCAMSESAAKQMILAQDQYDLCGSDLEERNLSLIGECVGFASADRGRVKGFNSCDVHTHGLK